MNSNNNAAEDVQHEGQNLQLQHQRPRQQSPGLKEPRPYRRRIKPPPTKVHHLYPDGFRRFVLTHTSSLPKPATDSVTTASTVAAAPPALQQPVPADAGGSAGDQQRGGRAVADGSSCDGAATGSGSSEQRGGSAACVVSPSPRSMQEAYISWCSSNDIPLSPGTMAELSSTVHQSDSDAAMASTSSTPPAEHVIGAWEES